MGLKSDLFRGDPKLEACLLYDQAHIMHGAVGNHVGKIQKALMQLDGAAIDSGESASQRYGQSTAAAVLGFKRKRKIINFSYQTDVDDIVGKMTIAALDDEWSRRIIVNTIDPGELSLPSLQDDRVPTTDAPRLGFVQFCALELRAILPLPSLTDTYYFDNEPEFARLFDKFRDNNWRILNLTITSHGQPGAIHTHGKIVGSAFKWASAFGRGYDKIFYSGAWVTFKGCNAAEGSLGRKFLEEFGKTFFWSGGGTVTGSDSMFAGFSPFPELFGPDGYAQVWGNTISLKFKPGGVIESTTTSGA